MTADRAHDLLVELHEATRRACVAAALVKATPDGDAIPLEIHRRSLAKWRAEIRRLVAALDAVEAPAEAKAGKGWLQ